MTWQTIDSAPRDGSSFQAKIPGHGSDNVIAWVDGYMDSESKNCCCWAFVSDQEPPGDWTDGVCWEKNEDGVPSIKPTHWKPLPVTATDEQ